MAPRKTKFLNFRIEPELIKTLKDQAQRAGLSQSEYLRSLIKSTEGKSRYVTQAGAQS